MRDEEDMEKILHDIDQLSQEIRNTRERKAAIRLKITEHLKKSKNPRKEARFLVTRGDGDVIPLGAKGIFELISETLNVLESLKEEQWDVWQKSYPMKGPSKREVFTTFFMPPLAKFASKVSAIYCLPDVEVQSHYGEKLSGWLQKKLYREVCLWTMALELDHQFNARHFLVPMVLDGHHDEVGKYLDKYSHQVVVAIQKLDSVIGWTSEERAQQLQHFGLRLDNKMSSKALEGWLKKWCIQYRVPMRKNCPRLIELKKKKFLQYVIVATFQSKEMSYDCFRERANLVLMTKKKIPLTLWFVMELAKRGQPAEAAKWAHEAELPIEQLPNEVVAALSSNDLDSAKRALEMERVEYYIPALPDDEILVIDEEPRFRRAMDEIMRSEYVGVDAEWTTTEFDTESFTVSGMAVLQIATKHRVFLLDMLALKPFMAGPCGEMLMRLFSWDRILKLGYGLQEDLRMLRMLGRPFENIGRDLTSTLDLLVLMKHIERFQLLVDPADPTASKTYLDVLFPYGRPVRPYGGLAGMVKSALGRPLDKRETMSNWERRQLRSAQIYYAAYDAYCLVDLYQAFTNRMEDAGVNFIQLLWDLLVLQKPSTPPALVAPNEEVIVLDGEETSAANGGEIIDICSDTDEPEPEKDDDGLRDRPRVRDVDPEVPPSVDRRSRPVAAVSEARRRSEDSMASAIAEGRSPDVVVDNEVLPRPPEPQPRVEAKSLKLLAHPPKAELAAPEPPTPKPKIKPCQLKVITDTMLQGLCRELRMFGVDASTLQNGDPHEKCVEIGLKEGRMIITRGKAHEALRKQVQEGHCLNIKSSDVYEQVCQVMTAYNVDICKEDIFTRCKNCNCGRFLGVPPTVMASLRSLPKTDHATTKTSVNCCINANLGSEDQIDQKLLPIGKRLGVAGLGKEELNALFCYTDEGSPVPGFNADEGTSPITAHGWVKVAGGFVNVRTCALLNGRLLKCDHVTESLVMQRTFYYVCCSCGHVYWDGSHYNRVMAGTVATVVKMIKNLSIF